MNNVPEESRQPGPEKGGPSAPSVEEFLRKVGTLPSLPSLYLQLTEELASGDMSPSRVSHIIAQDLGLTTKILQIANSAYFGLSRQISNVERAVLLLGLETIRALALSASVFAMFEPRKLVGLAVAGLWRHSMNCSGMARRLGTHLRLKRDSVDHLTTAAFLHDVGKLLMADQQPKNYAVVTSKIEFGELAPFQAEREVFGFDHAEVAAYLFDRWQLPSPVIEGVRWHHDAAAIEQTNHTLAAIIHVLDFLEHQRNDELGTLHLTLDSRFLETLGGGEELLDEWRTIVEEEPFSR